MTPGENRGKRGAEEVDLTSPGPSSPVQTRAGMLCVCASVCVHAPELFPEHFLYKGRYARQAELYCTCADARVCECAICRGTSGIVTASRRVKMG